MNQEEKLLNIINHYGVNNQQRKLQEEVFELNEAIFDYENTYYEPYTDSLEERTITEEEQKKHLKEHIAEEIADVEVMLMQFKEYYHIDGNDILKVMNEKINRQIERIENESNR